MKRFRWGIFGTGSISAKFVAGLAAARSAEVAFVASRSLAKAQAFAAGMGIGRAVEGYAEAAALGGVDAIYIATPPSEHAAHAMMCIAAGIPVLVEKPLGFTQSDAVQIADAARGRSVFAMEALWTRFLPAAQALKDKVGAADIGEVRFVRGSFGTSQAPNPVNSLFNPALGGGALAHLGVYPLSLGQWLFGRPILSHAMGIIGPTGVEEDVAFQVRYRGNVAGSFFISIRAWAPDDFQVLGSEGVVSLCGSIVRPFGVDVSQASPRTPETADFGWRGRLRQHALVHQLAQWLGRSSQAPGRRFNHFYSGNGYHYEADEVRACIERGSVESTIMPLEDSLAVAAVIDQVRHTVHTRASLKEVT